MTARGARPHDDIHEDGTRPSSVVALAASAGGPNALAMVLAGLRDVDAAILIVQHIQAGFVDGFVEWMSRASPLPVSIAIDGSALRKGAIHIAPANVHLKLGFGMRIVLDPEPVTMHRPSADELFRSLALSAPDRAIGVLLTGMGQDGATGLLELRQRGGTTIAQDEASSAVFGMPRAAIALDAVDEVLPLEGIAPAIIRALKRRGR